jgi:hypothetical protein
MPATENCDNDEESENEKLDVNSINYSNKFIKYILEIELDDQ